LQRRPLLLGLLLAAVVLAAAATAGTAPGKDIEVFIPKPPLEAKFVPGLVIYPKLATPAFLTPGSTLEIKLAKPVSEVKKVIIDDGYGHQYSLDFSIEKSHIVAKIPGDAAPGVYDLILVCKSGVYGELHAIVVASRETYKMVYLVHITDRHFGVINANGRSADNYDLAVNIVALGLPNNTIIVDTGDVADTARDVEYTQSIWTDYILNKPLIGIPGNHDHVGASPNYAKYRGEWNYTLSIYGLYRVVALDSGGDGYITQAQAEWAAKTLTSTKEPVKIVMFHHPHFTHIWGDKQPPSFNVKSAEDLYKLLISKKPHTEYTYVYSSWLQNQKAFKTLVAGMYNAPGHRVVVLSGHVHLDSYAEVHRADGTTMNYIVTTATGGSVRPGDYHGFRVIELTDNGSIEIMGDGPYYSRHASFNSEGIRAGVVHGPAAVATYVTFTGTNVTKLMEKTVVAILVPKEYYGKKLHLRLVNLESYRLRCTALGCVIYAYTSKPPKEGVLYEAVLYEKPDSKPPSLRLTRIYPPKPVAGRQVVLSFTIGDDSWGIESIDAILKYNGKEIHLLPSVMGNTMRIIIPPLGENVEKAKIVIKVRDAAGRETLFEKDIVYQRPAPRTTTTTITQKKTTTTTKHATTTATATTTTTMSVEKTGKSTTTTPTTAQTPKTTPQPAPSQTGGGTNPALVTAIIIVLALAAFAIIATRGGR
jgi:hypothetical protein